MSFSSLYMFLFLLFYHLLFSRWVWGGAGSTATQQGRRGGRSDEELGRGRGFSSLTRGGGQRDIVRGRFVLLSPTLSSSLYISIDTEFSLTILAFYFDFLFFSFQGLNLLQRSRLLWEEVQRLEERVQQLETEGGERWRRLWQGQRQKVSMGSWGELHCTPTLSHLNLL